MTRADELAATLDELLAMSPDVEAAAVVSTDGLPMASALPGYIEEDRLAAMSAALLSLGERAAEGLNKGQLAQMYVHGSEGDVILMGAGPDSVLVVMTAKNAKAGLVLFEMRESAAKVAAAMAGSFIPLAPPLPDEVASEQNSAYAEPEGDAAPSYEPSGSTYEPAHSATEEGDQPAERASVWGSPEENETSYSNWQ